MTSNNYRVRNAGTELLNRYAAGERNFAGILIGVNLTEAKLGGADLTNVDLSQSVLCQVSFSQIKLAQSLRSRDIYCPSALLWQTTMPDGTFVADPRYEERF